MAIINFSYPLMKARPHSEWLDVEPIKWIFHTDPSMDESLAIESIIVQALEILTYKMRADLLIKLALRYGVRNGS